MTFRLASARYRVKEILDIMATDSISKEEKFQQLKEELAAYFSNTAYYKRAKTMGQLVKMQLKQSLQKNLMLVPKTKSRFED
jgi:hypothetical protein